MNRAGKFHAFDLDCMAFTARAFQDDRKWYKRPGWNRSGGAHAATRRYFCIPISTDRIRVRVSLKISMLHYGLAQSRAAVRLWDGDSGRQ